MNALNDTIAFGEHDWTGEKTEGQFVCSLCKQLSKLCQAGHKAPPAMCVVKGWGSRKPYPGSHTNQRQLHMRVCVACRGLLYGLHKESPVWSMTGKTIEIHPLPYPKNVQLGVWIMTGQTIQVHSSWRCTWWIYVDNIFIQTPQNSLEHPAKKYLFNVTRIKSSHKWEKSISPMNVNSILLDINLWKRF